ncbi:MAG: hypothetical protein KDD70_14915, partial [Bdellovibrionales bacterium]|nr:hypothetical protein [Bdellovibrionales bacterium]
MHASNEELVHLHIGLPLLEESAASAIVSSDCMYVPYRHMQEMTAGILFSSADIHHFQIIWHGGSLQLRVVTPKAQALLTKSIILAMQLGAQLTEVSPLLPTNSEQAEIVATTLTYEKSSIFPIRYSNEITGEPIHYLLQAFGTLPSEVSVIAQLSTMPASAPTWLRIRQTAAAFYQRSAGWLAPKYWKNKELREAEDAAIQKKSTGEYGLAELSIGAFVDENYLRNHSRTNAKDRLAKAMKIATEAYSAFARPDINAVIPKSLVYGYTALRKLQPGGRLKGRHSMIMNDFEIASLWSIPKELRSTKLVHSLGKELPIPTDFLKFSNVHDFLKIGENGYRGRTASFGIAQDARDHHLLIHGTESNETISLAYELLAQDFTSQRPIALLTESKLFFEQVTQLATNTAPQQLLFLDFLNGTASCQLNLFDLIGRDEGEGKVLLTNVFKATFGERWTCEVHELFTNSCDRLFSLPYSSLLDIEALLAVEEAQLGMLNDSIPTAANKIASSENARNELLAIVSELLEDDTVQCVFGNPLCALNFQTFIRDGGQIFILLP